MKREGTTPLWVAEEKRGSAVNWRDRSRVLFKRWIGVGIRRDYIGIEI